MTEAAVKKFLELTHDKYYHEVGHHFADNILGIFTDEPQFAAHKGSLEAPWQEKDLFMPWTADLPESLVDMYEYRVEERLPEISGS
jgi:hypothetical protein